MDWNVEVVGQLESHWKHQLRPRLDGLTDHDIETAHIETAGRWWWPPARRISFPLGQDGQEDGTVSVKLVPAF